LECGATHFNSDRNQFFTDVLIVSKNSIKTHFVSESVGERQIIFEIDKDIVETIIGDMMYKVEDEADSDNEVVEKNLVLCNEAERIAILVGRRATVAKAKERVLLLFKRTKPNKDGVLHSYIVTIPKTKTKLFHLAICYVL
jgi:hypothetical protein